MAQKLIQTQQQKLIQTQKLSQQQMMLVKMLEMPLNELEESINAELDDNPALESSDHDDALSPHEEEDGYNQNETFDQQNEREERESALEMALNSIGKDDVMPEVYGKQSYQNAEYEEMVYGDTVSFYDKLKEQMGETELGETEQKIMEYLIGSLDDDGLLRKDLGMISDELAIYQNIYVDENQLKEVLKKLQKFDPPGVGAQNLQQCLLLQIERKPEGRRKEEMEKVVTEGFDAFTKKHWDKIRTLLDTSEEETKEVIDELRKLNPKPGAALGETLGRNIQQITPDFIVDTNDDGSVTFTLNRGQLPELTISPTFKEMVDTYKTNKKNMSKMEKEALLYAKKKVDRAQGFIEAVKQRRETLYKTMKAIIKWQYKYFADGDEADLKPMILKDIAEKTGLDISTISRVSNEKYAQTRWGTFPLKFFFTESYVTDEGEELSTRTIKMALKEIIDKENKKKPMSDDKIKDKLKEMGYPIARRTVAKYREQLNIPVARLRKH